MARTVRKEDVEKVEVLWILCILEVEPPGLRECGPVDQPPFTAAEGACEHTGGAAGETLTSTSSPKSRWPWTLSSRAGCARVVCTAITGGCVGSMCVL